MKFHFKDVNAPKKDWLCSQCLSHIPLGVSHHIMTSFNYYTTVSLRLCSSCKEHCKVILDNKDFAQLVDIPFIILPWAEYVMDNKKAMGKTNCNIASAFIRTHSKNLKEMDEHQFDVFRRSARVTVKDTS